MTFKPTEEQSAIIHAADKICLIPLTQGKFAIVDADDGEKVSKYKWFAHKSRNTFYAETKIKGEILKMHHLIVGSPFTQVVDHKNRDGLDNRKDNLIKTDFHGNAENKSMYKNNKSGTPGVYYSKTGRGQKRWTAQITRKGKQTTLGKFMTKEEAILARLEAENVYTNT